MNRTVRDVGGLILSIILMVSMYGVYKGGTTNVGNRAFGTMHRMLGDALGKYSLNVDPSLPWNQGNYDSHKTENHRAFDFWKSHMASAGNTGAHSAQDIEAGPTGDTINWGDDYNDRSWDGGADPASKLDFAHPYVIGNQVHLYEKGDNMTPAQQGAVRISPNSQFVGGQDLTVK